MSPAGRRVAVVVTLLLWVRTAVRAQDAAAKQADAAKDDLTTVVVPADMCRAGMTAEDFPKPNAHFPSYVEDDFSQLKAEAPGLRGLKFEADPTIEPEKSKEILDKTGELIVAMLPRVPNLLAKEQLSQAAVPLPYVASETTAMNSGTPMGRRGAGMSSPTYDTRTHPVEGEELQKVLDDKMSQGKHTVFGYRIQSVVDATYGPMLQEYRTDAQNAAVDVMTQNPGNPRGVGFSATWMMFKPANLDEARFRFLGHQKVGKHDTMVVAFAQIPGEVPVPAEITLGGPTCSYLQQGLVWIDEPTAQIVRLQTDLLQPLPDIHVTKLYSSVTFSEVRIPEKNLTLWLPDDVEIRWVSRDQAGAERHKYSDYRLFGATSRIVLP